MLSRLGYLGCIISATQTQLTEITNIITNFIIGRLNFSKKRVFLKESEGGLGMIEPKEYLSSQQVVWLKKAHKAQGDAWSKQLLTVTDGNIMTCSPACVDKLKNPIIYGLVENFQTFARTFINTNSNINNSYLLNNPVLKRGLRNNRLLDRNFFSANIPQLDMGGGGG